MKEYGYVDPKPGEPRSLRDGEEVAVFEMKTLFECMKIATHPTSKLPDGWIITSLEPSGDD